MKIFDSNACFDDGEKGTQAKESGQPLEMKNEF